jgi:phenylalanyl-tRNA synthetase alpha chain
MNILARRLLKAHRRYFATAVDILGVRYERDKLTNVTPVVIDKVERRLHKIRNHPLNIISSLISSHFNSFTHLDSFSPVVSLAQNFDDLGFPLDHPGRSPSDTYYVNQHALLRTHTSAHEVEVFKNPSYRDRWLLTADVYRRDEIDASHYPVFNQMEGAKLFDTSSHHFDALLRENQSLEADLSRRNIIINDETFISEDNPFQPTHDHSQAELVVRDLKNSLNSMILALFSPLSTEEQPIQVRWINDLFPFTSPSFQVEVWWKGEWLEILGCGVVKQATLDRAGMDIYHLSRLSLPNQF